MNKKELADEISKSNRRKAQSPAEVEKEDDLNKKAKRRGHLGRKITIRVRGTRPARKRPGGYRS